MEKSFFDIPKAYQTEAVLSAILEASLYVTDSDAAAIVPLLKPLAQNALTGFGAAFVLSETPFPKYACDALICALKARISTLENLPPDDEYMARHLQDQISNSNAALEALLTATAQ